MLKSRRRGDTGADHSGSKGDHRCDRSTEKQTDDKTGGTAGECDLHLFPGRFSKMDNAKGKYFVLTQDITVNSDYENEVLI